MANLAFSSVSIRDYTDLGNILLYCTSTQPTTVVYDPNNNSYLPDWSTSNLVITPVIQYNGAALPLSAQGLNITYKKKEGSDQETNLGTGESVSDGVLTVSANKLASITSGLLTYICHVSYTDPEIGIPIDTQSSLTYTLISQSLNTKSMFISGESTFLYNSDGQLRSPGTITLTVNASHVQSKQWQYKKSNGDFMPFPTGNNQSITGDTLNVLANEQSIWLGNDDYAVIKVVDTSDADVYDIHQVDKIKDGAKGNATLTAQLSNQSYYVPCDENGNIYTSVINPSDNSFIGGETRVFIYEGGNDVTSSWSIQLVKPDTLVGTYDATTHIFKPTQLTSDTSYCDFQCTKQGTTATLTVRYTITKTRAGVDGKDAVIYSVEPNVLAVNQSISKAYTPTTLTFSGKMKRGDQPDQPYSGRFRIWVSENGSTFPNQPYSYSSDNESSHSVNLSSAQWPKETAKMVKCIMYEAGGFTNILDEQIVMITKDGENGNDGSPGANGISMGLGNYQDVIPCNTDGTVSQDREITIPFYAYSGIQRIDVSATIDQLPEGISFNDRKSTPGTSASNGKVVLNVSQGSSLSGLMTGDITITLTCTHNQQTQNVPLKYSWTKNVKAANGQNAVIMEVYSPNGGVIKNSANNTTLRVRMISGASEVTPTSIQWKKYQNGSYVNIPNATGIELTVTPAMVDDLAFFMVTASYNGVDGYTAYYTVDDLTDPYMAYTFATVQEFKNNTGCGAVYTRVYQNGVEVDPIKSTTFSTVDPSTGTSGAYYYYLDTVNKKCKLKKYNGTVWVDATSADADEFDYSYFRNDSSGNPMDTGSPYSQDSNQTRCLYVDPSLIGGRMVFVCQVSKKQQSGS